MVMPFAMVVLAILTGPVASDSGHVVEITASEYALTMPDSIPAGLTTFVMRNHGIEFHIAALARLDSGKTVDEFMDAYSHGGEPAWAHVVGGPGPVMPGREGAVTIVLKPGRYAVFCDIAAADHVQHWKKGMMKSLTVVPSSASAAAPASDVAVTLVDYTFQLSKPLTAGAHVIRVTNGSASRIHMVAIMRFAPGKTLADEMKWDHRGPEPIEWATGTTDLSPGQTAYVRARLKPGSYGLFCFDDDPDGTPHLQHGMQQLFTVK
jgi:hypothetical protein